MNVRWISLIGAALLLSVASASADDTLESVEKQVIAKWEKVTSMSAKMNMKSRAVMGPTSMSTDMAGTIEMVKKDGKTMLRQEVESHSVMKSGETENKMDGKMVSVSDGETMLSITEQAGQKMATRMRAQAGNVPGGKQLFDNLRANNELSLGDNAKLAGAKCWVVVAKAKTPNPAAPAKSLLYFRQSDGVMVKMEGSNAEGKTMNVMTMEDIKLNQKIDPARFKLEVPEGVQVMDMTGAGQKP